MLVEHFCDMDIKNYVVCKECWFIHLQVLLVIYAFVNTSSSSFQGQTAFDVADIDMVRTLEELKKKQATLQRDNGDINAIINKKAVANPPKRRSLSICLSRSLLLLHCGHITCKNLIASSLVYWGKGIPPHKSWFSF